MFTTFTCSPLAPRVGFEPTTNSLTGSCTTVVLPRNVACILLKNGYFAKAYSSLFKEDILKVMRNAYALLGLAFTILLLGAWFLSR